MSIRSWAKTFVYFASLIVTACSFLLEDDICYHSSLDQFLSTIGHDSHIGSPYGLPYDSHHARRAVDMVNYYPTDAGCHRSSSAAKCYKFRVQYDKDSQSATDDRRKGAQFFTHIPGGGATYVTLEYDVYFPSTFIWDKHGSYDSIGGKLPGLYGGDPVCSGGRSADDHHCFSTRYMWRDGGRAELYLYFPRKSQSKEFSSWKSDRQQHDHVTITEHDKYGISIRTSSFQFHHCNWYTLKQHIHLNDVGSHNGWIDVYLNGHKMFHLGNVAFRTRSSDTVRGIFFSTFFGGHDPSYGSQKQTYTLYKNFKLSHN